MLTLVRCGSEDVCGGRVETRSTTLGGQKRSGREFLTTGFRREEGAETDISLLYFQEREGKKRRVFEETTTHQHRAK